MSSHAQLETAELPSAFLHTFLSLSGVYPDMTRLTIIHLNLVIIKGGQANFSFSEIST